jgi:hypothetical protein
MVRTGQASARLRRMARTPSRCRRRLPPWAEATCAMPHTAAFTSSQLSSSAFSKGKDYFNFVAKVKQKIIFFLKIFLTKSKYTL